MSPALRFVAKAILIYGLLICGLTNWRGIWTLVWISTAPVVGYLALLYGLVPDLLLSDIEGILQTRMPSSTSRHRRPRRPG